MPVIGALQAKIAAAGFDAVTAQQKALGAIYNMAQQQAALLAYTDDFRMLGYLALFSIPVALTFERVRGRGAPRFEE